MMAWGCQEKYEPIILTICLFGRRFGHRSWYMKRIENSSERAINVMTEFALHSNPLGKSPGKGNSSLIPRTPMTDTFSTFETIPD